MGHGSKSCRLSPEKRMSQVRALPPGHAPGVAQLAERLTPAGNPYIRVPIQESLQNPPARRGQ